jgi:hypothetical protein
MLRLFADEDLGPSSSSSSTELDEPLSFVVEEEVEDGTEKAPAPNESRPPRPTSKKYEPMGFKSKPLKDMLPRPGFGPSRLDWFCVDAEEEEKLSPLVLGVVFR